MWVKRNEVAFPEEKFFVFSKIPLITKNYQHTVSIITFTFNLYLGILFINVLTLPEVP